jgi:hypothetical protein
MGLFPEVRQDCEICRTTLNAQPDTANRVYEIEVRQIGPVPAQEFYGFVVCSACKCWAMAPLLRAWAEHRTPEEIDSIRNEMADFGLNKGNDR